MRFAIVVLLAVIVAAGGYLAGLLLGNPSPRSSPGWTLLASLPTPRGETAAAVAGERLYLIGGLLGLDFDVSDEVSVYDPAADAWEPAPPLPAPRHHAAAAALGDTVYVAGGASPDGTAQDSIWSLAPGVNGWQPLAAMPEGRLGHRMVALGGALYVVGGIGSSGLILVYDPATGAWSTGSEIPTRRDHLAAVVVDGEIWAIGGRSQGRIHALVDIYDPATDTWRAGPALPEQTSGAAEAVLDGVILISGGEEPSAAGRVIDLHWQLDTSAGDAATWEPMPEPPLAVHGAPGAVVDGRFLIAGGALRQGGFSRFSWTPALQAYDPP